MENSTFRERIRAFRDGVLKRPVRVAVLLGLAVLGNYLGDWLISNSAIGVAVCVTGIGGVLIFGWVYDELAKRPPHEEG
jgi:hypothetical protein